MDSITTERLLLRRFELTDAEAMQRVLGDAEVMRYSSGVLDQRGVEAWVGRQATVRLERGLLAVALRRSGSVIGYCGLTDFADLGGRPETEIGYRLARAYWRQGYAAEAAAAVRDHAEQVLGQTRLVALIDPSNTASIRVAEKIGMRYEKEIMQTGYDHPDHLYVTEA